MADWIEGEVVENRQWNTRLFSLRIKVALPEYKAGQFVRVALVIDGEVVARPYSLVNAPAEPLLEIYFNIVADGPLTPRLANLSAGDHLLVADRASGFLTIDEVPECNHLWLIATGTGVGPFLAALKTAQPWQRFDKVVLVYSVRTADELSYQEMIDEIRKQHAQQFCFVPCVTRQAHTGALQQRIPAAISSGALEQLAGVALSASDSHVMMCGNADMIRDVSAVLEARGMRRHRRREPGHFSTEKYH